MWERECDPAGPLRKPAPAVAPRAPTAPALELQRRIGNRAATSVLARDTKTKAKPKALPAHRVVVSGIGTIELEGFNWATSGQGATGPGSGSSRDEKVEKEIVLSTVVGEHSSSLQKALMHGEPLGAVEIVWGDTTIRIVNAYISSYKLSGPGGKQIESWTLSGEVLMPRKPSSDSESSSAAPDAWTADPTGG